jgi:hypothetical protein
LGYPDGHGNLYAAFGADPVNFTDPMGTSRRTAHGGANYLGDYINEVDDPGLGSVLIDTAGNTVSDLLLLDTIADKMTIAGDSGYSPGERVWAGTVGTGAAAFDLVGGRVFAAGAKRLLASRLGQAVASRVLGSRAGEASVDFLLRDVKSFLPGAEKAAAGGAQRLLPASSSVITDPARLLPAPASVDDVVATAYRNAYDEAWQTVVAEFNAGGISMRPEVSWKTVLGRRADQIARLELKRFLGAAGIAEGPGEQVLVNRWLRDPLGSEARRVPDLMLRASRKILDGTIGSKSPTGPQILDFIRFSGGYDVEIVAPRYGPQVR